MNCQDCNRLANAWVDGELDPLASEELERHLGQCAGCSRRVEALRSIGVAVRAAPLYAVAPAGLVTQVRARLRREVGAAPPSRFALARWGSIAAAVLLAGFIGWSLPHGRTASDTAPLAAEVLSAHLRSLMADHLLDVPSSDRHTVKPWFTGRIDFSPEVRDCAAEGFPLQGGRLDYLAGQPVAALIYRHGKHVINVFVFPTRDPAEAHQISALNGFHERRWAHGGLTYWAVSDAGDDTLRDLQNCLSRESPEPAPASRSSGTQ